MLFDSRSRSRLDPSGSTARRLAGRLRTPFFTRQASCAPVAAAVTQRAMLKKFRSARFSVPGRSAPTVWSNSFCSLVA